MRNGTKVLLVIVGLCLLALAVGSGAFDSHSGSSGYTSGRSSSEGSSGEGSSGEVSFGSSGDSDSVKRFKKAKRDHASYCRQRANWAIEMNDLSSAQSQDESGSG
jgi:hypothetical protein